MRLLILCLVIAPVSTQIHNLINDFYNARHVKQAAIINCKKRAENIRLIKFLSANGYRINVFDAISASENVASICPRNDDKLGIVLDLNCPNWGDFIRFASNSTDRLPVFNLNRRWILYGKIDVETLYDSLTGINVNIDSEMIYARSITESEYELYEVYNSGLNRNGRLYIAKYGFWNRSLIETDVYKYERRSNMSGVVLKCMIVVTKDLKESFLKYISSQYETYSDSMNRFNYGLLLHVRDMYNFRYDVMRTKSWGYNHNGTFDGMVGQLQRKLIDIGGSPVFFRVERAEVVDYTIPTWLCRPCFIFRHPKSTVSIFRVYVRPFTDTVWIYASALMAVMIAVIYAIKFAHNVEYSDYPITFLVLGVLLQNSVSSDMTKLISGKIVFLTVWVFSILFYQFYSASIVSSLLMDPPRTIRTLDDLSHSNLKLGIEDILYNKDYFRRTTDPVALELYDRKIVYGNHYNFYEANVGVSMMKSGGFAFHADVATAYKIIQDTFTEQEICDLSEIPMFPAQKMMAIVQKGSPYRKLITYGLRKIQTSGLLARQRIIWHAKKPECTPSLDPSNFTVNIVNFSSVLIFLLFGAILSTIVLYAEIKLHDQRRSKTVRVR